MIIMIDEHDDSDCRIELPGRTALMNALRHLHWTPTIPCLYRQRTQLRISRLESMIPQGHSETGWRSFPEILPAILGSTSQFCQLFTLTHKITMSYIQTIKKRCLINRSRGSCSCSQ
jgi:hypothetical protein